MILQAGSLGQGQVHQCLSLVQEHLQSTVANCSLGTYHVLSKSGRFGTASLRINHCLQALLIEGPRFFAIALCSCTSILANKEIGRQIAFGMFECDMVWLRRRSNCKGFHTCSPYNTFGREIKVPKCDLLFSRRCYCQRTIYILALL